MVFCIKHKKFPVFFLLTGGKRGVGLFRVRCAPKERKKKPPPPNRGGWEGVGLVVGNSLVSLPLGKGEKGGEGGGGGGGESNRKKPRWTKPGGGQTRGRGGRRVCTRAFIIGGGEKGRGKKKVNVEKVCIRVIWYVHILFYLYVAYIAKWMDTKEERKKKAGDERMMRTNKRENFCKGQYIRRKGD